MRILIIGAGISGLACATRLAERGADVAVLERATRVGGLIQSVERNGFIFELGPQSFQPTPALSELIRSAGLESEILAAPARAPRFVLVGGRLLPAPTGPAAILRGGLLGLGARLRLLRDLFGRSHPPGHDESFADFVRRKFGSEMLDRLAGPFVSGIYAGDPERLGYRDAFPDLHRWEVEQGSIIRGALRAMRGRPPDAAPRPLLANLRRGHASLLQTLAEKLGDRLRLDTGVESLAVSASAESGHFELRCNSPAGPQTLFADAVVCATPAHVAAQILAPIAPQLAQTLAAIEYAPVAVVGLGYRRDQVRHPLEGFGFLVARSERRRLLGAVWESWLFPGRAPAGHVNLACFIGGATDSAITGLPGERIGKIVIEELAAILGITGRPVEQIVTVYRRALPQYNLGHRQRVEKLRAEAAKIPGLLFIGNYLQGPSTGSCVQQAFRAADQILSSAPGDLKVQI